MSKYSVIVVLILGLLLAACGVQTTQPDAAAEPTGAPTSTYVPVVAASELEVGPSRLPIGILKDGTPINDPNLAVSLRFFYLDGDKPDEVRSEMPAVYRGEGLPIGLYVANPDFDKPGGWGVEVSIPLAGGQTQTSRLRLDVVEKTKVPSVGSAAIPSANLTAADVPELDQLTSDFDPDPDLYQLSIADAIAAKKPFLLMFATPGYCQTAVCAPNLQVIKRLQQQHADQVNFVHVEVYPYPFNESFQEQKRVPAMIEWNLVTEPWTFLIDANGIIQAKYEGGITYSELEPALEELAAGKPVAVAP